MKKSKERKGVLYLFNDIIVVAAKETGKLTGKPKLKYQWTLPLVRVEISDSKVAYGQQATPSKVPHPIRLVVDQTGVNPENMFHIKLSPPGKPDDPLLKKTTRDSVAESAPAAISLAVLTGAPDMKRKWLDKINEQQKAVLGKAQARQEAIEKVHGKKKFVCCIIL